LKNSNSQISKLTNDNNNCNKITPKKKENNNTARNEIGHTFLNYWGNTSEKNQSKIRNQEGSNVTNTEPNKNLKDHVYLSQNCINSGNKEHYDNPTLNLMNSTNQKYQTNSNLQNSSLNTNALNFNRINFVNLKNQKVGGDQISDKFLNLKKIKVVKSFKNSSDINLSEKLKPNSSYNLMSNTHNSKGFNSNYNFDSNQNEIINSNPSYNINQHLNKINSKNSIEKSSQYFRTNSTNFRKDYAKEFKEFYSSNINTSSTMNMGHINNVNYIGNSLITYNAIKSEKDKKLDYELRKKITIANPDVLFPIGSGNNLINPGQGINPPIMINSNQPQISININNFNVNHINLDPNPKRRVSKGPKTAKIAEILTGNSNNIHNENEAIITSQTAKENTNRQSILVNTLRTSNEKISKKNSFPLANLLEENDKKFSVNCKMNFFNSNTNGSNTTKTNTVDNHISHSNLDNQVKITIRKSKDNSEKMLNKPGIKNSRVNYQDGDDNRVDLDENLNNFVEETSKNYAKCLVDCPINSNEKNFNKFKINCLDNLQDENPNNQNNVINISKSVQIDDKRIETILDGNNDSFINELADLFNNVVDDKHDPKKGTMNGTKIMKPFVYLKDINKNQNLVLSSMNEEINRKINLDLNEKLKISDNERLFPGVETISYENKANDVISYNSRQDDNCRNIRTTKVKLKEKIKDETNENVRESSNHDFFFLENKEIFNPNNFQNNNFQNDGEIDVRYCYFNYYFFRRFQIPVLILSNLSL